MLHRRAVVLVALLAGTVVAQPVAPTAAPAGVGAEAVAPPRFGSPSAHAKAAGSIRLATYNIENLFDDQDDPALTGEFEDKDGTKPEADRKAAAAAIHALDADVLCLEEVESKAALLWFRDGFLADMGYVYAESLDAGDPRGIEQSVLSRFPLKDVKNWPGMPLGGMHPEKWGEKANKEAGKPLLFHRSPLRVTVEVPRTGSGVAKSGETAGAEPYRLTLFVVHHKSGREGDYWREAEAKGVVKVVKAFQEERPEANIAVLGDFNARSFDPPLKVYEEAGLIDAARDFYPKGKGQKLDPAIITHESGRAIDHILLSPSLVKEVDLKSVFVLGTAGRPKGTDWRTEPKPVKFASDHYPVAVDMMPGDKR